MALPPLFPAVLLGKPLTEVEEYLAAVAVLLGKALAEAELQYNSLLLGKILAELQDNSLMPSLQQEAGPRVPAPA